MPTAALRSRPRLGAAVTALLASLFAASCGFGSAGIAAALGKNSRAITRTPTQLTLLTPTAGQAGRVALSVGLDVDPNEALVVEAVDYSLLGADGTFRTATPALGFPNEVVLGATVTGGTVAARSSKFFPFVWNSHFDLDALHTAGTISRPVTARAVLRVRIRNTRTGEVITKSTSEFFVDQSLLTTIAGGGVGDGNDAASASMLDPTGVTALSSGAVYIADTGNHRIRRVGLAGTVANSVTTAIGTGFQGGPSGTNAADRTSLNTPVAVAADANGNLFVAETGGSSSQLRAYEQQSGLVFDLLSGFNQLSSLSLSSARQLYIAEAGANVVWRLDLAAADPFLDPPAFGDLRSLGAFAQPLAVAGLTLAGTDTVYIVSGGTRQVARIVGNAAASNVAGGGAQAPAVGLDARTVALTDPFALAASATHLYVADRDANRVLAIDANTLAISNVITTVTLADNTTRALRRPAGLALDGNGNLAIVETGGSLTPGAVGHQVLVATAPQSPTTGLLRQLAAGGAVKQVTQSVAAVQQATASLVYERTPRTG